MSNFKLIIYWDKYINFKIKFHNTISEIKNEIKNQLINTISKDYQNIQESEIKLYIYYNNQIIYLLNDKIINDYININNIQIYCDYSNQIKIILINYINEIEKYNNISEWVSNVFKTIENININLLDNKGCYFLLQINEIIQNNINEELINYFNIIDENSLFGTCFSLLFYKSVSDILKGINIDQSNMNLYYFFLFLINFKDTFGLFYKYVDKNSINDEIDGIYDYLNENIKQMFLYLYNKNEYEYSMEENEKYFGDNNIMPKKEEIDMSEYKLLKKLNINRINGYVSVNDYIYSTYHLLRADIIIPFQKAIKAARKETRDKNDSSICSLYENVKLIDYECRISDGIIYLIEFDNLSPNMNWKFSYI